MTVLQRTDEHTYMVKKAFNVTPFNSGEGRTLEEGKKICITLSILTQAHVSFRFAGLPNAYWMNRNDFDKNLTLIPGSDEKDSNPFRHPAFDEHFKSLQSQVARANTLIPGSEFDTLEDGAGYEKEYVTFVAGPDRKKIIGFHQHFQRFNYLKFFVQGFNKGIEFERARAQKQAEQESQV